MTWRILLLLCSAGAAYPDTVTTTDHLSVNGSIKQMAGGAITLEAVFSSGKKTLTIPMSMVESIEFNATTFNPGAPPRTVGLGPGTGQTQHPDSQQAAVPDTIILRGGNRAPCKVVGIDEDLIHCEAKGKGKGKSENAEYSRRIVLRILVGGGR